jgi:hypothetical protein
VSYVLEKRAATLSSINATADALLAGKTSRTICCRMTRFAKPLKASFGVFDRLSFSQEAPEHADKDTKVALSERGELDKLLTSRPEDCDSGGRTIWGPSYIHLRVNGR